MVAWWDSLAELERIFAAIAIPATVILVVQTILLLFGLSGSSDGDLSVDNDQGGLSHDHDFDPGLRIFTVRGFIAFFSVFGWSGIVFLRFGTSTAFAIIAALILGFISMVLVGLAIWGFIKLQADGTANIHSAVGSTATVYIAIPPRRKGLGKVTVMVSGSLKELDACTDYEKKIPRDEIVNVIDVSGESNLVVMPLENKA